MDKIKLKNLQVYFKILLSCFIILMLISYLTAIVQINIHFKDIGKNPVYKNTKLPGIEGTAYAHLNEIHNEDKESEHSIEKEDHSIDYEKSEKITAPSELKNKDSEQNHRKENNQMHHQHNEMEEEEYKTDEHKENHQGLSSLFIYLFKFTHIHIFSISLVIFLLSIIFMFSSASSKVKILFSFIGFIVLLGDLSSLWLTVYFGGIFEYILYFFGLCLALVFISLGLYPLYDMWVKK